MHYIKMMKYTYVAKFKKTKNESLSFICVFEFHLMCKLEQKFERTFENIFTSTFVYKSKYYWIIYQKNYLFSNRLISNQCMEYNYSLSINKSYFLPCTQSKKEQEGTYVASFLLCVPLFKLILRRPNCISHVLLFSHVNIYHAIILSMNVSF